MYLQGTATTPLGIPDFVKRIAPASVAPTGTFLNWKGMFFSRPELIKVLRIVGSVINVLSIIVMTGPPLSLDDILSGLVPRRQPQKFPPRPSRSQDQPDMLRFALPSFQVLPARSQPQRDCTANPSRS